MVSGAVSPTTVKLLADVGFEPGTLRSESDSLTCTVHLILSNCVAKAALGYFK